VIKMGGKYVTSRLRLPVRVLCVDAPGPLPVVALVEYSQNDSPPVAYTASGRSPGFPHLNLVPADQYANVYRGPDGALFYGPLKYDTYEQAEAARATSPSSRYVGTVKVTE
jgi:hypothetical protein